MVLPFLSAAKVLYWNNPKENATNASKFAPNGEVSSSDTTSNQASSGGNIVAPPLKGIAVKP